MSEEQKILPLLQPKNFFVTEFKDYTRVDYYLTGNIGDPEEYIELCHIIRTAPKEDVVVLHINSPGGQVRTGNMIINAISESQCTVVGYIENDCGSMATYIFLACHTWAVSDNAEFFVHTCTSGSYGKEHETFEQAAFLRKQVHKLIRKSYANFLTPEEIDKVIGGSDIYLDADDVLDRLPAYAESRKCTDPDCDECEQEVQELDIEALVEEIVTRKLEEQKPKSRAKGKA
jgi:ATP-dependent Clp protease, protease subunit